MHFGSSLSLSFHLHGHPCVCDLFTFILPFYFLLYLPPLFLFLNYMKSVVNLHNSCNESVDASDEVLLSKETCSAVSAGKAQSSAETSKTETCWQGHSLRGLTLLASRSRGRARRDWWLRSVTTLKSRSMYRIQLKIEIKSDSSTAIDWEQDSDRRTLTRGTFGYKNEFMMETSVSRKFLRRKTAQMWNEASLCFSSALTLQVCRIGILLTKLHYKMKVTSLWWIWWRGCRPDVNTETRAQKQTVLSDDREHRDGCATWVKPVNGGQVWALLTMNRSRNGKVQRKTLWTDSRQVWSWRILWSPWTCDDGESRYRGHQVQAVVLHEPSVIASTLWIGRDAVGQSWTLSVV